MKSTPIFLLSLVIGCAIASPFSSFQKLVKVDDGERGCGQNDEDGLGPLITGMWDLIPIEPVLNIFFEYAAEDEDVIAILTIMGGPEFRFILDYMFTMPEFLEVTEYFCEELKLDVYFYINSLGGLFDFPELVRPTTPMKKILRPPGWQAMLDAIFEVIPTDEIAAIWDEANENDEYLARAIAKLKSDTFKEVADRIEGLPQFQHVSAELKLLGFDMVAIIESMRRWLGWIE